MGKAAEVKQLINDIIINDIIKQLDTNHQIDQFEPPSGDTAVDAIDLLREARTKYKQVTESNRSDKLGLLSEIMVIGKSLNAVQLDLEARQLAAEGKISEAEKKFEEASKMEPEINLHYPSSYIAQRVVAAAALRLTARVTGWRKKGRSPRRSGSLIERGNWLRGST